MRPNVSDFLIYEESTKQNKYWANYADENLLIKAYNLRPWTDLTDTVVEYVSTARPGLADKRTPLQDLLQGEGREREIDTDFVSWRLRGTGEIQAIQLSDLHAGVSSIGINGTEFDIHLDVEWFVPGDILAPSAVKEIQVIVNRREPAADGRGFVYSVVLSSTNPNNYFPAELRAANLKWIKLGSVYSEGSFEHGSFVVGGMSYIEFQSELSDYGKKVQVSNKAHQLNLRMVACDEQERRIEGVPDRIISMIEAEFMAQVKWERELMIFFGRAAGKHVIDRSTGLYRRYGPGLIEFMEDGNVIDYPLRGGSLDMFEEFLQSIWFDRIPPERRNVVVYTGQGGLKLFRDWVSRVYSLSAFDSDVANNAVVRQGKSFDPKNSTGLQFPTAYFTGTTFFPFGSLRVEHWPILDSEHLNGDIRHPDTGLPLSSYEFIVMDVGLGNGGGSNIELLKKRDSEVFSYICGTWSPLGPINGGTGRGGFSSSHTGRHYELVHEATFGLRVKDVTLTAWFKPAVQF